MDRNSMLVALSGQICGTILLITLITTFVRRRKAVQPAQGIDRLETRLANMQQALDAVAIEVERISEGQRFATKLLSERSQFASAEVNGNREPVRGPSR
ncbi:MAG TPA: hypothetical protein VGJ18_17375 [Gemmatimonadaceae bacterium]|jgi:hypothetical protein